MTESEQKQEPEDKNHDHPSLIIELEKLRKRIVDHVEDNYTRRVFAFLTSDDGSSDPLLAAYAMVMLKKMSQNEQQHTINAMVKLVHEQGDADTENTFMRTFYESTVDSLLMQSHREGVLTLNQCVEGLVMTTDFTLRTRINQKKWNFVKDCMTKLDYKGTRTVFRYIMESLFPRLPLTLTSEQVGELVIVQDIILNIVDRNANNLPSIFIVSEVKKGLCSQAYQLPRLAHKFSQLCIHYRPIAELCNISGRSHLFPLPQHPCFNASSTSWKIDGSIVNSFIFSNRMSTSFLPHRKEHSSVQTKLLYMVLRQPRGRDSISLLFRNETFKAQWESLLSVLVCETMTEAEKLNENEMIPKYQFENIHTIISFYIQYHQVNVHDFFTVLKQLVRSTNLMRARDEVMWVVLQILGSYGFLNVVEPNDVAELYTILFDGEVIWAGASDHPGQFAKFLAAASVWMLMGDGDKVPKPNEHLQRNIDFIKKGVETYDVDNPAVLALLANSFRSESEVGKKIVGTLSQMLEGAPTDEPMLLTHGRLAGSKLTGFTPEFLDALTNRAKLSVIKITMNCLRNFTADRLPSPVILDTIWRLCHSMDLYQGINEFVILTSRSLKVNVSNIMPDHRARDQLHFLLELFAYRLHSVHLPHGMRFEFLLDQIKSMTDPYVMQNWQLYQMLEQTIMRQFTWGPFTETISISNFLFGDGCKSKPYKEEVEKLFLRPESFSNPHEPTSYPIAPEIVRMLLVTSMRVVKITGHQCHLQDSTYPVVLSSLAWPNSLAASFPRWTDQYLNNSEMLQPKLDEIQHQVRQAYSLHRGLQPELYINHMLKDPSSPMTILAVIYLYLCDDPNGNGTLGNEFYKVLEKLIARQMVVATNILVDFVTSEALQNGQDSAKIGQILTNMVFRYHVVRPERLLLSLVMHPTRDEVSVAAMHLVNHFCTSPEFVERVKTYSQTVPRKDASGSEVIRKLIEFNEKYREYSPTEMAAGGIKDNLHLPIYFGSAIERMLPVIDHIVTRSLELQIESFVEHTLHILAHFYKYHPFPITFIYSTLFTLFGRIKKNISRTFLLEVEAHVEDAHLTASFAKYNHQRGSMESLIYELTERIQQSLEIILVPPPFVSPDWKTAEFSPGAQTLYLACTELMASPHSHETIVLAMVNVLIYRPHRRPHYVVNSLALILTALPVFFGMVLEQELLQVLTNGETEQMTFEEIVFHDFEESQLLNLTTRPQALIALAQAYYMHCSLETIYHFMKKFSPELISKIVTEKDLWYALRLICPLLARCYEYPKEHLSRDSRKQHLDECMELFRKIHLQIAAVHEGGQEILHQDELCGLLYYFKYVFVGDIMSDMAETLFPRYPTRMRELLKYYASQSDVKEDKTENKENSGRHPRLQQHNSLAS